MHVASVKMLLLKGLLKWPPYIQEYSMQSISPVYALTYAAKLWKLIATYSTVCSCVCVCVLYDVMFRRHRLSSSYQYSGIALDLTSSYMHINSIV